MTHRRARRLMGIAGGIAAAAVGWQTLPLRLRLPPVVREAEASGAGAVDANAQAAALLTYDDIARHNPFDIGRRPPAERYLPPEVRAQQAAPPAGTPAAPRLRLVGVATGPMGAVALIDANPSIPGAEIYRVGDPVGLYRLEAVSDTAVVLRGKEGVRTLRLESLTGRSW